jgi:Holliday junction resolvasome RuvABC endonuclease subunit
MGLDLGTDFGIAVIDGDGRRALATTYKLQSSTDHSFGIRLFRLESMLNATLERLVGEVIVGYESVNRHAGTRAAHVYGAYYGIVERFVHEHGLRLEPVSVSAIKKTATGSGRADKQQLITAARDRWGEWVSDSNSADALWVAETVRLKEIH